MSTQIRIAGIVKESIVDGPGIRLVVFTQGCKHNCPGCHNPSSHSFEGGTLIDTDDIIQQIRKNPLLDGVTFSGGEPFEQAEALTELALEIRKLGLNIITYTGYTYEYITESCSNNLSWSKLMELTDILIDGRFEADKKDLLLKFRGSSNQRTIDVKKSISDRKITILEL